MKSIEIGKFRYAFDEHGSSGPLVIFGHGLYFDASMFRTVAERLSDSWRCVCIDWPGHGSSSSPEQGWTIDDLVDDVPALIDAMGARQAVLVGLSQGAAVFTRVALKHPSVVRALVAMDASPLAPDPAVLERNEQASQVLRAGDDAQVAALFDAVVARMFSASTVSSQPLLVAQARARMDAHPRRGLSQAVRLSRSYRDIAGHLEHLSIPTLVLWGEDDRATPPALVEHYRRIPGVATETFPDAGHSLALERPDEVAAAIRRFLDAHAIH
ncbi:MAG: alpha/beta fold hydrolase [Burkholderiaceae bacterium]